MQLWKTAKPRGRAENLDMWRAWRRDCASNHTHASIFRRQDVPRPSLRRVHAISLLICFTLDDSLHSIRRRTMQHLKGYKTLGIPVAQPKFQEFSPCTWAVIQDNAQSLLLQKCFVALCFDSWGSQRLRPDHAAHLEPCFSVRPKIMLELILAGNISSDMVNEARYACLIGRPATRSLECGEIKAKV